ncbi:hypothetical protein [Aliiroseovarius crassostreae]|uniref:hypothetical protein n=1 Tax=Aliiroseovarius crassostreae TaxID=154981 RepID=UPI0022082469|nr:hypothetical protein [Aliiroseovarius crassostreae]UWQ05932.1 hypothetical protein K3X22_05745 [Aliiroseovarius crassostreae]
MPAYFLPFLIRGITSPSAGGNFYTMPGHNIARRQEADALRLKGRLDLGEVCR